LTEIRKLLGESEGSVQLAFDRQYLFCKIKNTSLFVRLIDGEYPDYKQVIPKMSENAVKIEKNILLSALKRVSHSANEKSRAVRFHVHPGMMVISSSNPEMGDAIEEIDVDYQGNEIDIAFNSKYLMDYLLATTDEVVELHAKDRVNPGILKGVASDHQKYVIMPMRI
jgi:DNA polymerase-3 subunit beta